MGLTITVPGILILYRYVFLVSVTGKDRRGFSFRRSFTSNQFIVYFDRAGGVGGGVGCGRHVLPSGPLGNV